MFRRGCINNACIFRLFLTVFCLYSLISGNVIAQTELIKTNDLKFSYEIVKRQENNARKIPYITFYIFLEEEHFKMENLASLFKLLSNSQTFNGTIIIYTDKEKLGWRIKRDEHPLLPTLLQSEEGRRVIDEKYSEFYPPITGYYSAEFSSNRHPLYFLYTPEKEEDYMLKVEILENSEIKEDKETRYYRR